MGMTFDVDRYVLVCATCGEKNPQMWQQVGADESCSACGRVVDTSPRDAIGQKVRIPNSAYDTKAHATDVVITSARQYADHLKRKGYCLA